MGQSIAKARAGTRARARAIARARARSEDGDVATATKKWTRMSTGTRTTIMPIYDDDKDDDQ